ncbi:MAG: hypothetical protein ACRDR6_30740 [Pseudonocardiaceae bacterium]
MLAIVSYDYTATGWYATFDPNKSRGGCIQQPVEAWSPDGDAMIVDKQAGYLVPVRAVPGFKSLHPCGRIGRVIKAAEGWQMHFADDDLAIDALPVIGWIIDNEGEAKPLLPVEGDGRASVNGWPQGRLTWPGKT